MTLTWQWTAVIIAALFLVAPVVFGTVWLIVFKMFIGKYPWR